MSNLSKQALQVENNVSFPNNTTGYITPAALRGFNTDLIDSVVVNSGTASFAITGSNSFDGDQTISGDLNFNNTGVISVNYIETAGSNTLQINGNTIHFTNDVSASGDLVAATISGSIVGIGNVTAYSASVDSRLNNAQGVQGATGTQGASGTNGNDGAQGATGGTGAQGSTGAQGPGAAQGQVGLQGVQGYIGSQGTQGRTGAGTLGATGATGAQGAQGVRGEQGEQGIQGAQGVQGTIGEKGDQGIQGASGTNGSQGAVGSQGSTGPQGTTGAQGTAGTTPSTASFAVLSGGNSFSGDQQLNGNLGMTGSLDVNGVNVISTLNGLSSLTSSYAISSSVAAVDAGQDTKINALTAKTGSYATTGSNTFSGNQIINGNVQTLGNSPTFDLMRNVNYSGSQYPLNSVYVAPNTWPTDIYGGFAIFTELGALSGTTFAGLVSTTYSPQYSGTNTPMIIANGNNPAGNDTAIAWTSNGQADHWKKSNFKYGTDITGSLRVSGSTTITGSTNVLGNSTINGNFIANKVSCYDFDSLYYGSQLGGTTANGTFFGYGSTDYSFIVGAYAGGFDNELKILTDNTGITFSDFNGSSYPSFLKLSPNTGANAAPIFTRGLVSTGSVTIASGSGDLYVHGHKQFNGGMFQNNTTLSGSAGVSQSIALPVTDLSYGVNIGVTNSEIYVSNAGVYNIAFSAQIETNAGADSVYIWYRKNGTNITDSATKVTLPNNTAQTMTVNILVEAAANDYFELVWQSASGNARILSEAASGNIPLIPAVIVTVTQVR